MPLYEYACAGCGSAFERLRKYQEREQPLTCSDCGQPAYPILSAPAAHGVNSNARPQSICGPGCGCHPSKN